MSVRIMCDSTADLAPEVRAKVSNVIPLVVNFDGTEYLDGVTISHSQFYKMLMECEKLPTTSQPSPDFFREAFNEAVDAGDEVVIITISQQISGTYQSAMIAAQEFPGKIHVVDSKTLCISMGILVEYAVQLMEQGKTAAEIAQILEKERERIHLIAVFDTMKFLIKGGRVSKIVGLAGELLGIKPVIGTTDGAIKIYGKARGRKIANSMMTKEILKRGGVDFNMPMMLGYTGVDDHVLRGYLESSKELWQGRIQSLRTSLVGIAVGTHAGPDAMAVAFFGAE